MALENATGNEVLEQNEDNKSPKEPQNENGESGEQVGAGSAAVGSAGEQGISYEMIMETLSAVQANQAKMSAQIQKLTDAQSVLVDAGAIVREGSSNSNSDPNADNVDGFVSIDELDLNI